MHSVMAVIDGAEKRRCSICQSWKDLNEYYCWERRDGKGKRWSPCKPCLKVKTLRAQRAKKAFIDQYKVEKGCVDCGYNAHPAALDFDHQPGFTKYIDIRHGSSMGWKRIYDEIEKCEVVCANCHRIRTYDGYAEKRGEVMPYDAQQGA